MVVVLLAVAALSRVAAHDRVWVAFAANTLTPYLYLPVYGALVVAALQRRHRLTMLATGVAVAHLYWCFAPLARSDGRWTGPPDSGEFRVLSSNVLAWNRSTEGIVREILESGADVVAIQELSPRWQLAFAGPEFARVYPHRVEDVRSDAFGSGIYAREPLIESDVLETPVMPVARATVLVGGRPVRIYSVHPPPPAHPALVDRWSRGLAAIEHAAREEKLPLVLAGDFNTTQHSAWYARLLRAGFANGHDACGRPFATTWPNGMLRMLPIRIDHVFVSNELRCVAVREGIGAGSDHRPVIADLALR
jgi:endonuclease/exonuclease/phosphatase (EEP) superfamily protein YafD